MWPVCEGEEEPGDSCRVVRPRREGARPRRGRASGGGEATAQTGMGWVLERLHVQCRAVQ